MQLQMQAQVSRQTIHPRMHPSHGSDCSFISSMIMNRVVYIEHERQQKVSQHKEMFLQHEQQESQQAVQHPNIPLQHL